MPPRSSLSGREASGPVEIHSSPEAFAARRRFLLASLGVVLTGCARQVGVDDRAVWESPADNTTFGHVPHGQAEPFIPAPSSSYPSVPAPGPAVATPSAPVIGTATTGTIPRASWASGAPVPSLMNGMTPVRYITIHHDGMRPFFGADGASAAARLDAIRKAHRGSRWGDIGYHFAVDRAGNVFEARPLRYQGAHVKNHNGGNIGIVALGNFERQRPTDDQSEALRRHVSALMRLFRVPADRVRTHREWAATACPGRELQKYVNDARGRRAFG